jgi:hypothetical protein
MQQAKEGRRAKMRRAAEAALAELEWFFTSAKGTVPPPGEATPGARMAATAIQELLGAIATFHRGALALRFTPRDWPESIVAHFGEWTGLVVRFECAAHPGIGKTSDLETAAVLRLEEMLAAKGEADTELARHERHARQHVRAAVRAYVMVRGTGPSVLPATGTVGA